MSQTFIYHRSAKVRWLFVFSLLIALVLDSFILTLPTSAIFPSFSLLVMFYWAGHFLDRSYIATAFIMGLLNDTLFQTPLGAHALIFVSLVYLLSRHRLHFRSFSYLQQALFICGYFLLFQLASWFFFTPVLPGEQWIYFWFMPVVASISWMLMAPVLNRFTQQSNHS